MIRRDHYSTALTQAQGIVEESLHLFEIWSPGMTGTQLFEQARRQNLLATDSERRLRNVVIEGFASRFLREPHHQAAPSLKRLFDESSHPRFVREIVLLYALRQHGIFLDFMRLIYWPAIQASGSTIETSEIGMLIDRGRIDGKLENDWSASVRKRVSSYVLGIAKDFDLVSAAGRGSWRVESWQPHEKTLLYLAYDLHFLELDDDQMLSAPEWSALGLERSDTIMYLQRFQTDGHLLVQDSGELCRIDWKLPNRDSLIDVLLR